jgi:hypothetical protein
MSKFQQILFFIGLTISIAFVSGCSEDDAPTTPNNSGGETCYLSKIETIPDSSGYRTTTRYSWNDKNQLTSVVSYNVVNEYVNSSDTIVLEYQDNRLISLKSISRYNLGDSAFSHQEEFLYDSGATMPYRVNNKEDGADVGYTLITTSNGNITKIERFDDAFSNGETAAVIIEIAYDNNGNVIEYNIDRPINGQVSSTGSDYLYDDKKNPYQESFALRWINRHAGFVWSANNVVSRRLYTTIYDQRSIDSLTYSYNSSHYPTSAALYRNSNLTENYNSYTYQCK